MSSSDDECDRWVLPQIYGFSRTAQRIKDEFEIIADSKADSAAYGAS